MPYLGSLIPEWDCFPKQFFSTKDYKAHDEFYQTMRYKLESMVEEKKKRDEEERLAEEEKLLQEKKDKELAEQQALQAK